MFGKTISRVAVTAAIASAVIAATASFAYADSSSVPWSHELTGGGHNLQYATLGAPTQDVGLVYTSYTAKVTVRDDYADGLRACVKIEGNISNDGQGYKEGKTFCDINGTADGTVTGWYTLKNVSSLLPHMDGYRITQWVQNSSGTHYYERSVTVGG